MGRIFAPSDGRRWGGLCEEPPGAVGCRQPSAAGFKLLCEKRTAEELNSYPDLRHPCTPAGPVTEWRGGALPWGLT